MSSKSNIENVSSGNKYKYFTMFKVINNICQHVFTVLTTIPYGSSSVLNASYFTNVTMSEEDKSIFENSSNYKNKKMCRPVASRLTRNKNKNKRNEKNKTKNIKEYTNVTLSDINKLTSTTCQQGNTILSASSSNSNKKKQ